MKINKDLIISDTGKSLYDLTAVTKQCKTVSKNNTSDISVSGYKDIHSATLNIQSGKALMIGSLALRHSGGTPQIQFLVDGSNYGGFFASRQDEFYSFSVVATGLSKGNHNFTLRISQGNASGVVVSAYTASELTVVEI
jgi:hypothetical protein